MADALGQTARRGQLVVLQDGTNSGYFAGVDSEGHVQTDVNSLPTISHATTSLTHVSGTASTQTTNALVAAPAAGSRIVVCAFVIQNEAATANTMILEDGTADVWRCFAQNQGDGLAMVFAAGREWRLTAATVLNLNLSAATACGYSVAYFVEVV